MMESAAGIDSDSIKSVVSSSALATSTDVPRGPAGAGFGPLGRMIVLLGPVGGALLGPIGACLPLIDLRGEAERP